MFRPLNEIHNLDFAIQNCKDLAKCLEGSLAHVRRLNLKYNTNWLAENYQDYLDNLNTTIATTGARKKPEKIEPKTPKRYSLGPLTNRYAITSTPVSTAGNSYGGVRNSSFSPSVRLHRNVRDILRSNSDMNLKLIKIKRNVESLLHNVEHTIKVSNKKSAYLAKQRCRLRFERNSDRKRCWCCH